MSKQQPSTLIITAQSVLSLAAADFKMAKVIGSPWNSSPGLCLYRWAYFAYLVGILAAFRDVATEPVWLFEIGIQSPEQKKVIPFEEKLFEK